MGDELTLEAVRRIAREEAEKAIVGQRGLRYANADELQQRHVSAAAPKANEAMVWNETDKKWEPMPIIAGDIDIIWPHVSVTSSASADTFGSWVEISGDIGTSKTLFGMSVNLNENIIAADSVEFEVGEGASSSEARVLGRTFMGSTDTGDTAFYAINVNLALTDNARITVRARDDDASTRQHRILLWIG